MMKKLLALVLALCILLPAGAFALNYHLHLPNEATFETMEEAHQNGPGWLAEVTGRAYKPDPAMDDYPEGTTWVYRSPGMYTCLSAALRMNTNFLVYTDAAFESKDDAYAYIDGMGLVDIVNACCGSIVLVTPINKEAGFGDADQYAFYLLQSAMCNLTYAAGARGTPDFAYYADNSYYGGLTNFPWKTGFTIGLVFTLCVAGGKFCGGILADKIGIRKAVILSLGAAGLTALLSFKNPVAGCISIFFFNMTMPLTLSLLVNLMPRFSGFAFGLLMLALFLGTLPGMLLGLTRFATPAGLSFLCFLSMVVLLCESRGQVETTEKVG